MKKFTLLAMSFMMALAVSAQNAGEDYTSKFENTDFESNSTTGWTITGEGWTQGTAAANNYQGTYYLETWTESKGNLKNFDWSQTREVPNGYYVIKMLGHAIKQNQTTTPESKGVYFYANDIQKEIKSTVAEEYIIVAKVTEKELTIGYRAVSCNVNWTACDYFRIIQCDGSTEDQAKLSWMKYEVQVLAEEFSYLEGIDMSSKLWKEMEASVDAIETVSTYTAADALYTKMKKQLADAEACIEAYEQLFAKIDEVSEYADKKGAQELLNKVEAAQGKYEAGAYDAAAALAEIKALEKAVYEYDLSTLKDGTSCINVTSAYLKDASVSTKENSAAWTITVTNNKNSMPAWGNGSIEYWSCDFTMSQTITDLPNGKYLVKVQGFYRQGGNDGGAAHKAGTENITAKLFANKASTPLVSLYKYTGEEMDVTENLSNGYVHGMNSANLAFNKENPFNDDKYYYAENELEVIVTDNTLTLGVKNASNTGDRWCIFRNFELWYYGNYPAVNFQAKTDEAKDYIANNESAVPYAINLEINEYIKSKRRYTIAGAYTEAEVNAAIEEFEAIWADALQAIELFAELKAFYKKVDEELLPLKYPGADALKEAQQSLVPYFASECKDNNHAKLKELKAEMELALREYIFSQNYSREEPLVVNYFVAPLSTSAPWVIDNGGDVWVATSKETGGQGIQRKLEDGKEILMTGLNSWSNDFTSMNVHLDIENLRDGVYTVSAEAITQQGCLNDQHVYATSKVATVKSEALSIEGWNQHGEGVGEWQTLTTGLVIVVDGKLRIGFASTSKGGTNGWFQVCNFKLSYYGETTTEDWLALWEATEERANYALDILIPNEKKELKGAMDQVGPLIEGQQYYDACLLVGTVVTALDSTITASEVFYNGYYAKLDTLPNGNYKGYEGCDSTYKFASIVIAMADEILEADDATCKLFPELDNKLHAYANYASSLRNAEQMFDTLALVQEYRDFVADSVIRPQVDTLLLKLRRPEYVDELRAQLIEALDILYSTANISKEYTEGEVADVIINPTCDIEGDNVNNVPGWTWTQGNGNQATHDAEHYDVKVNDSKKVRMLNSWASGLTSSFKQEIIGIPDGFYRLTVAARADGDNAYIFAATTPSGIVNDTTKWEMIRNYGNKGGEIWKADSLAWVNAENVPTDTAQLKVDFPYLMVNYVDSLKRGIGYGWSWHVIDSIEVTNHYLAIGFTADPEETGENFTGSWMSADDWKLELILISEEQSEYSNPFEGFNTTIAPEVKPEDNPETAVEVIEVAPVVKGIYDLYGRRLDAITAPGLYIVNGKKVVVK